MANFFKSKIDENAIALTNLQEQYDSLNTQFAELQEQFKSATQNAATFKSEFERLDVENKQLKEQLKEKDTEIVEVVGEQIEIEQLASLKAVEVLAECSHPQVELVEEDEVIDNVSVIEQFKSLKGKELQEFYNTHKKEIHAFIKNGKQ